MRVAWLAALVLLGCGASATQVSGPDGSGEWYSIECKRSRSNCIEKASEMCPRGYEVESSHDDRRVFASVTPKSATVGQIYTGQMLVKCHEGAEP